MEITLNGTASSVQSVTTTFEVTLADNDAPIIGEEIGTVETYQGASTTITVTSATDRENDEITLVWTCSQDYVTASADSLTVTFAPDLIHATGADSCSV